MKIKPFKLPKAILNMLEECTNGYYLVTIDDQHEFQTFVHHPNQVIELGLLNYVDLQSSAIQQVLRQKAIDHSLEEGEDESTD